MHDKQFWGSGSLHQAKKQEKKLLLCDFFYFLPLKTDVNVPLKIISKESLEKQTYF
jgi:hypothetical protein